MTGPSSGGGTAAISSSVDSRYRLGSRWSRSQEVPVRDDLALQKPQEVADQATNNHHVLEVGRRLAVQLEDQAVQLPLRAKEHLVHSREAGEVQPNVQDDLLGRSIP